MKILHDVIGNSNLVSIDYTDVKSMLRGTDSLEIFMFEGKSVDKEIKDNIGIKRKHGKCALVNITGSSNFKIKQCAKIVERVAECLDPKTIILWGARIDENAKIPRVTVLIGLKKSKKYKEIARKQ